VTIEPGSVITLEDKAHESGFVDVSYRGQNLQVFMRDVENARIVWRVRPASLLRGSPTFR
jgi:hypothetical protein